MSGTDAAASVLPAILLMAAATYFMRAAGFWMMGHVRLTARVRRMLEALPGSIVAAIVVPIVAKGGAAAVLAIVAAGAIMVARRNEILAIAAAVGLAAAARGAGL